MNSLRFYIFFNIFNILLIGFIIFCVYISAVLTFDIQGSPGSDLRFLYGAIIFITYITLVMFPTAKLLNKDKLLGKVAILALVQVHICILELKKKRC